MKRSTEFVDPVLLRNVSVAFDAAAMRWMPKFVGLLPSRAAVARKIVAAPSGKQDPQPLANTAAVLPAEELSPVLFPQAHRASA